MGKHTTELSCAALSFDMTFFALVRLWLTGDEYKINYRRCYVHLLKKRPVMCDCPSLEYSAYVSAYLAYYKLYDDANDERGIKRFFSKVALVFAKIPLKKIPKELSPVGDEIRLRLLELSRLENEKCDTPSAPADSFGELLGYAMSFGLDEKKSMIAKEIGKHIGRYVYLADAAIDYHDDIKNGSYNPFACAMNKEEAEIFFASELDGVLSMEAVCANRAFELGDELSGICAGCIRNIITKGLRNSLMSALLKNQQEKEHEKSI